MKKKLVFGLAMLVLSNIGTGRAFAQQAEKHIPFDESVWRVEQLSHQKTFIKYYQNDQQFTQISFNPYTHKVRGSGLCNKFLGSFQYGGNQIMISRLETQKNICSDDQVNQQDILFFDALKRIRTYSVTGKILRLMDDQNRLVMTAKYFK